MELDCPHLSLARHWAGEDGDKQIALVDSLDALRLCGAGTFETVSSADTLWNFERESCRLGAEIVDFAVRVGLASPWWGGCDDDDLSDLVAQGIARGNLVGLRKGKAVAATKPTVEQRRLVAQIDALTRGRLHQGGRHYKLVAGDDLDDTPDRDSYVVVPHDEARQTLDRVANEAGAAANLATLLGQARDKLTPDWRPPLAPDGLILLRRSSVARMHSSDTGPALTPSQIRKLAQKKDWIEIEIVDQDGEPYSPYHRLQLADNTIQQGTFPDDGLLSLYEIDSGTYKLTLGEVKLAPAVAEEVQEETPEETPEEEPASAEDAVPLESAELTEEEEFEAEPETEPEERSFTIKVVDEYGDFVPGVEVHFGKEPKTSGTSSPTSYTGTETSVPVSFGDPAKVAEALALHYKNPPATRSSKSLLPSADTLVLVSRPGSLETPEESPFQPFVLNAGDTKTICLRRGMKRSKFIGLHNTWFRNNSAVVNPEGEAPAKEVGEHESLTTVGIIASILRYNEEHPGQKLFIAGHTDRAGKEQNNDVLSLHRAKSVLALVEGDKTSFVAACKAKNSEVDVTQLMDWTNSQFKFKCKPSVMDRPPSDDNYYLFRQSYKAWIAAPRGQDEPDPRGAPISETGRLMDDIWAAMFDLYEHNLRQELGENAKGVAKLRGLIQWVDAGIRAVGYGEKHTTVAQTPDGERSDSDRRVEAIFFQPGEEPVLSATNGDDIYDTSVYTPEPIPAMVSAKKWTAEWDRGNELLKMDDVRSMLLWATGLPPGTPMVFTVDAQVDATLHAGFGANTASSGDSTGRSEWKEWFQDDWAVMVSDLQADQQFPRAQFRFTVNTAGRRISSAWLEYEDVMDVQLTTAAGELLSDIEYQLATPWGYRKGKTTKSATLREAGIPPGGACLLCRNSCPVELDELSTTS